MRRQPFRHFHSKAVISQKNISDSCHQNSRRLSRGFWPRLFRRQRFHFPCIKEETVTWLPQEAQIASRIVIQHYADMTLAFIVLLDALDQGDLSSEGNVEHIAALPRAQTHAIADMQFDVTDD